MLMGRMKGAGFSVSQMIQFMFLIVIGLFLIYIIIQWVTASELALRNVEEASLIYTLTSSVNAFSVAEKGRMEVDWGDAYDIEVECREKCYMKVTPYEGSREGKTSEEFLIIGDIEHRSFRLTRVGKVCVEKGYEDPKDRVVIREC
jgi:hypothetical protein